jgi:phosphoribosyl-dephospho-CoA transferase
MNWKRHTLVDISDTGREEILAELAGNCSDYDILHEKLGDLLLPERAGARIPGIVRREESAPRSGCVAVGFCGVVAGEGGRMRVTAFAKIDEVLRVTTPYELLSLHIPPRTPSCRALAVARDEAGALGLTLGVWGSAALEIYTGLPYTHDDSDLDLLVAAAPSETLSHLFREIKSLEERFNLRIDVEVDLRSGYGVHLKELLGQTSMVIGKSLAGVDLLNREQVLAELPHQEFGDQGINL